MLIYATLGLAMLAPGLTHANVRQTASVRPVLLNVAANNHVQGMLFHGNDQVAITSNLSGPDTGFDLNSGMAFAPDGSLWTANVGVLGHPPALEHFARGAGGDAAPIARITCGLAETTNIAVDRAGNVYALNRQTESVAEFSPTQNGCATPIAVIQGSNTQFSQGMLGINIDAEGRIYVGSFQLHKVVVFAPGASGNVAPIGILQRGVSDVASIAFDARENVYVANEDIGTITVYAAGKFGANVAPIRTINGGLAARPSSIAITPDQRLVSLNFVAGIHELFEYPAGANGNIQPDAIFDSVVNPSLGFVNNIVAPFQGIITGSQRHR